MLALFISQVSFAVERRATLSLNRSTTPSQSGQVTLVHSLSPSFTDGTVSPQDSSGARSFIISDTFADILFQIVRHRQVQSRHILPLISCNCDATIFHSEQLHSRARPTLLDQTWVQSRRHSTLSVLHTFQLDMLHPTTSAATQLIWLQIVLVCVSLAHATDCPPDAVQQAKACTALLNLQPAQGSPHDFIQEGDGTKANYACGNGDLLNAISCQERILERCKDDNTDSAHFLRNMIDIEKARRAVTYFCTNVKVYMKNAKCIAAHHQDQVTCARDAMKSFQTQMTATRNKDALLRFQCRFFFAAVLCTEDILTRKCSSYVSDIVTTVMIGFEPPVCNNTRSTETKLRNSEASYDLKPERNNDKDSAPYNHKISSTHLLTFLLCLLLRLLC
ncbi:hypothetical protein RRG08_060185 [Elysia crispata]|uniref:Uncharacterized protein n=1 Tax=Elysia crispata TaxID=231223 RepID=A0AAE1DPN1_9GAST|nr:hypothetical protein RRG08_060185 [Elysia crispata]